MRRAVVTGGAGFIGSHLVDRLVDEAVEVLVIDDLSTGHLDHLRSARLRGRIQFHQLDIRDPDLVVVAGRFRPDTVFHLAAQASVPASVAAPLHDADVNVLGTINVMEMAHKVGVERVVFASSGGAMHGAGSKLPAKESHVPRPDSPYGVSKLAALQYLAYYRRAVGLDYVALLPSNVYGPRQSSDQEGGVVSIFAETLLAGKAPTIFGDGEQTRDFVFVADVVDAFLLAARKGGGRVLHVSTGRETSVNSLFEAMGAAVGTRKEPRYAAPRPGEIARSVLDASAARRHLGWEPWTALADGLAATVSWMRQR